uniref:Secreted protein n=1 Tax=Thraustotheca clavata TaxID=74557 RepID=A0A0A7CM92_9STRA|nr:secreted protein [Thraustotheca clavata]
MQFMQLLDQWQTLIRLRLLISVASLVRGDSTNFVPLNSPDGIGILCRECVEPLRKAHSWNSSIFFESDAVAMRFHFDTIFLPPGDSLVLRSVTNSNFNLSSIFLSNKLYTNVWTPRVFDSLWTIELQRTSTLSYCLYGYGAAVDSYEYFTSTNNQQSSGYEQGCGLIDHTVHAICGYDKNNRVNMYTYSHPVVRIWIPTGNSCFEMCTGWLWGSQGHVLTASHCIGNALDAKLAQFEFLAEATWCEANIEALCSGIVSTVTATWVTTNSILDYTLLLLSTGSELVQKYGYLQVDPYLQLAVSQPIYIPQHPRGGCKLNSFQNQLLEQTSITSLEGKGCDVNNDGFYRGGIVYDADTDVGSSGSPVIELKYHTVIALHYCGGESCQNAGIPMSLIPPKALRVDSTCTIPLYPDPVVIPALLLQPYQYSPILGTIQRTGSTKQPYATTVDTYELVVHTPTQFMNSTSKAAIVQILLEIAELPMLKQWFMFLKMTKLLYIETYQPYLNDGLTNPSPKMLGKCDGSISDSDPYLVATLTPGTHLVAFGISRLSLYDAVRGINTNPATVLNQGPGPNFDLLASIAYQMTISSTQPIQLLDGNILKTLPTCTIAEAAVEATCQQSDSSGIYD